MLPSVTFCYLLLPSVTFCYLLLPSVTFCYLLLPSVTFCYLLLPSVTFCYLLLPSVTFCYLLLPSVTFCYLLLPSVTFCYLLLPSVTFCYLLLPSVTFCYLLVTFCYDCFGVVSNRLILFKKEYPNFTPYVEVQVIYYREKWKLLADLVGWHYTWLLARIDCVLLRWPKLQSYNHKVSQVCNWGFGKLTELSVGRDWQSVGENLDVELTGWAKSTLKVKQHVYWTHMDQTRNGLYDFSSTYVTWLANWCNGWKCSLVISMVPCTCVWCDQLMNTFPLRCLAPRHLQLCCLSW